jgi:hypothetical protein
VQTDVTGEPVLGDRAGPAAWQGDVPGEREVFASLSYSDRWRLDIDGEEAPARVAFGSAMAFESDGGAATLRYETPSSRRQALLLQIGLWVAVAAATVLWRDRLRRRERLVGFDGPVDRR